MFFIRDTILHHGLVIISQHILTKPTPPGFDAFNAKIKQQSTDRAITHGEMADFGTDFLDHADVLMPQGKRKRILQAWKMAAQEFGLIAKAGNFGFHQCLVGARFRDRCVDDLNLVWRGDDDGFHAPSSTYNRSIDKLRSLSART